MISISYGLKRTDEEYNSSYSVEDSDDHGIFLMKGKNDRGKTTVLKIIALAFGALDITSTSISPRLKDELRHLVSDGTELKYSVKVKRPRSNETYNVEFNGKESVYRLNDNEIGKTAMLERFSILFEIPEPIEEKLASAVRDAKNKLNEYLTFVERFGGGISTLFTQVSDFESAKENKERAEELLERLRSTLENLNILRVKQLNKKSELRKQLVIYKYRKLEAEHLRIEANLKIIKKKIREVNKTEKGKTTVTNQLLEKSEELRGVIYENRGLFQKVPDEKLQNEFSSQLKYLRPLSNIDELSLDYLSKLSMLFANIQESVQKATKGEFTQPQFKERQELDLVKKLIDIVREYSNINPEVPGLGRKLTDLLTPLEIRKRELRQIIGKDELLHTIELKCSDVIRLIANVVIDFEKYSAGPSVETSKTEQTDIDELRRQERDLDRRGDDNYKEVTKIIDEYNEIPESELENFEEDASITSDYDKAVSDFNATQKEITDTERSKEVQEGILTRYTDMKRPNTNLTLHEITDMGHNIDNLKTRLGDYITKLEYFKPSAMSVDGPPEVATSNLYTRVGEYLARVLEVVYHNHTSVPIERIDFQGQQYILPNNKGAIKFVNIGKGHSSLNSIMAKIKQETPGKIKIFLIDEISDMDPDVQGELTKELERQIVEGIGLVGVLTERGGESEETLMIPI